MLLGCARCVENNKGSSAVSTGLQEKFLNPLCVSKTLGLCDFAHEAYRFGVSEEFPVSLPFAVLAPAASNDPSLLWPEQAIPKTGAREANTIDSGSFIAARDTSASTLADPRVCPIEHLDFGKPTDVEAVACAGKYQSLVFVARSVSRYWKLSNGASRDRWLLPLSCPLGSMRHHGPQSLSLCRQRHRLSL